MTTLDERVEVVRDGDPTGEKDRYNKPILGPDIVRVYQQARVAPNTSTEPVDPARQSVQTTATVYIRSTCADVRAKDRLRFRGYEWQIDGDPEVWPLGVVVNATRKRG